MLPAWLTAALPGVLFLFCSVGCVSATLPQLWSNRICDLEINSCLCAVSTASSLAAVGLGSASQVTLAIFSPVGTWGQHVDAAGLSGLTDGLLL